MPVQCAFEPEAIRSAFLPFARPDYVEGMILGDDLDSLLSAAYLHGRFGWPVAGVYCQYERMWSVAPVPAFWAQASAGKLIGVDLDLNHGTIPCIGHHILHLDADDVLPGHTHSLNPNALAHNSVARGFRQKYPLATIHFLLWLFEEDRMARDLAPLVWLADSAFLNAQHYRDNVAYWVRRYLSLPAFADILPFLQTAEFEQLLGAKVLAPLIRNPLCRPGNQLAYTSNHLRLNGYQCQFSNPHDMALPDLLSRLCQLAGWPVLPWPEQFAGCTTGRRRQIAVQSVQNGGTPFAQWLEQQQVFSYAFVYRDSLNYTVDLYPG